MIDKLVIYPTTNCNLKCNYCFYRNEGKNLIDFNRFKKAFNKFLKLTQNPQIYFLGGEPLLYKKNTIKLINYIKKIRPDIPIILFTNATLIDNQTAEFIKKNNLNLVVSLDGNKFSNDLNRKGKDISSVYQKAIDNLKKYDLISYSSINMVVRKNTLDNLFKNIKYLYKLGFKSIGYNIDFSDEWELNDLKKIKKQINQIFLDYLKLLKLNKNIYRIPNRYEIIDYILYRKVPGCHNIVLMPDGNFYFCDKIIDKKILSLINNIKAKKNIQKERKIFFKKLNKKNIHERGIFCQVGIYLYYRYLRKLKGKELSKKLQTIFTLQTEINNIYIKQFKILLKYKKFRELHSIK